MASSSSPGFPHLPAAIVRVPAWFTAEQALRVADLKGVDRVLVDAREPGWVSRATLAQAPAHDLCARWKQAGPMPASHDDGIVTSHAA